MAAKPPEELDDNGGEVPRGYARVTEARPWRAALGGTVFVLAYGPAAILGFSGLTYDEPPPSCFKCESQQHFADQIAPYAIPLVGPLVGAGTLCEGHSGCIVLSVGDALLQATGVYFLVTGLTEHSVLRRTEQPVVALRSVSTVPLQGGAALSLSGWF